MLSPRNMASEVRAESSAQNPWASSYPYQASERAQSRQSQYVESPYRDVRAVKTEPYFDCDSSVQEMQHELQRLRYRVAVLERRVAGLGGCCEFCSRSSHLVQQVSTLENAVRPLLSRTVHWYLDNSMQFTLLNSGSVTSELYTIYGYSIRLALMTRHVGDEVWLAMYLSFCPGPGDWRLEWPFIKSYTLSLVHPLDSFRTITRRVDPRECDQDTLMEIFGRPVGVPNRAYGCKLAPLGTLRDLFGDGRLHLTLNVEL